MDPLRTPAVELVVSRPRLCTFGALRRIRLEVDGVQVGDLRYGGTMRVSAAPGLHVLRARCRPWWSASLPVELGPDRPRKLEIWVDDFQELQIGVAPGDRDQDVPRARLRA